MIGGLFSNVANWWADRFGGGDAKPDAITKILQDYGNYLQYQDVFGWIGNTLLWGMIKGLYRLNQLLEETIYQSFTLKDLLNAAGLTTLYQDLISKVLAIFCVVTLIYLGIKFAVSKHPPKFKNVLVNLALGMVLIFGSSSLIDEGLTVMQGFYGDVTAANKENKTASPAFQIIQNNVWDTSNLLATDAGKLETVPNDQRNGLTVKNFKLANINQVITPEQVKNIVKVKESSLNKTQKERLGALQYRLELDDTGKEVPVEINDEGFAKLVYTSGYRRYSSKPGIILSGELSLTVAYLFILFTIVTCIIELGFKKFYLVIAASTDFETGQRMKTAIDDVWSAFLLLGFTILELKIYTLMLSGIGDLHAANKLNGFLYVVALIVLTIALFKGSQSVTKIFGVDTSLKNGGQSLMSLFALGSIAKNAAGSAKTVADAGKSGLEKLNELRKNAFSKQAPDTGNSLSETGAGEASEPSTLPKSDKRVGDVFNKGKEGLSKVAGAAGYTAERGLKNTVGDLKEKAADKVKDAVGKKLEGTRAQTIGNAVKNPSAVLDKAKGAVDQLKTDMQDSYGEGELSAAVKNNQKEDMLSNEAKAAEERSTTGQPNTALASPTSQNHQKVPMGQLPKRSEEKGNGHLELPNKNGPEVGSLKSTKVDLPGTPVRTVDPGRVKESAGSFVQPSKNVSLTPSRLPENGNRTTVSYALDEPRIGTTGTTKPLVSRPAVSKPLARTTSGVRPASMSFEPTTKITVSKETREKNDAIKQSLLKNITK